jgi:hypothetical protein
MHGGEWLFISLQPERSEASPANWIAGGLQYYNAPPEVRKWVRRLIALALVPPARIDQAFQALTVNAPNIFGCDAMIQYVRHTYVDANALFQRPVWNFFGQRNRTTNVCEGYHHIVNEKFRRGRPDPFQFINFLQEQEADIERRIAQLQVGVPPIKKAEGSIRPC